MGYPASSLVVVAVAVLVALSLGALAAAQEPGGAGGGAVVGRGRTGDLVRGTYASPKAFWDRGARLDEHGVNAVFVHSGAIDDALVRRARVEGCRVFAEFATLNGGHGNWVRDHPDAHPIDD